MPFDQDGEGSFIARPNEAIEQFAIRQPVVGLHRRHFAKMLQHPVKRRLGHGSKTRPKRKRILLVRIAPDAAFSARFADRNLSKFEAELVIDKQGTLELRGRSGRSSISK